MIMTKGIYKIINPKGKVYIGQSINIESRFKTYKRLHCRQQPMLFESLAKYGWVNHKFEIIEECKNLNEREQYWIDIFKSDIDGLNKIGVNNRKNFPYPTSAKIKKSIKMKKLWAEGKFNRKWAKKCKHLETGKTYNSIKEVCSDLKMSSTKVRKMLGESKIISYI